MRVAVLISGRGSNMAALAAAAEATGYPAEIALVLADRADAAGLAHAQSKGIATEVVERRGFESKPDFEAAIDQALDAAGIEFVCLAGFMRLLSEPFVERRHDRIINIHPSLLPEFPGLDTHQRALDAGAVQHGCTVHFVRAAMDSGPIIVQAAVPVRADDDAERLAARVLQEEHAIYPLALRLIAEGRARVIGEAVTIDGPLPGRTESGAALIWPG